MNCLSAGFWYCKYLHPCLLEACDSFEPCGGARRVFLSDSDVLLGDFFGGWDFASGFTENGWGQASLPTETHRKRSRLKCRDLQSFSAKVSGSFANMEINSYKSVFGLTENTLQTPTAEALYLK